MKTVCCVCLKTKIKDRWLKRTTVKGVSISHGLCPKCYGDTIRSIYDQYEHQDLSSGLPRGGEH
ncbi:MAG: hypothetical protein KJ950_03180 [Proteobacteria bacterium]|nr:hypothetical protein [Pseudomonadota bacterium]